MTTETPADVYLGAATVYCAALNERVPPDPDAPPEWPWNMRPEFRAAVDWAFAAGRAAEVEERRQDAESRD